jgi:hypothetical protein
MNESAQISSVKAISDSDRTKHLKAINEGGKCIDRKQREMRMHLKAVLDDFDDDESDDVDPADDPALLEANDDQDDPENEGMSMLLSELKALAEQAKEPPPHSSTPRHGARGRTRAAGLYWRGTLPRMVQRIEFFLDVIAKELYIARMDRSTGSSLPRVPDNWPMQRFDIVREIDRTIQVIDNLRRTVED